MSLTIERFVEMVSNRKLLSADEVLAVERSLPQQDRPLSAQHLARALVDAGKLTDYQATALCEGKDRELVLGDYVVLEQIGAGGMGRVFKAVHRRMERVVALKVLALDTMGDDESIHRFHREVKAAARLSHPNIVTAYDAGEDGGVHYLVMEYIEGQNLTDLVQQQGPLPAGTAIGLVLQGARGLGYAHQKGIVHRDVKPSNLLLENSGTVKILDMGLARFRAAGGTAASTDVSDLTGTGMAMGTLNYVAPEQALDARLADHRSDIYSLGCTLHYLLTGRSPAPRGSAMAILKWHEKGEIPSLRSNRPDVPERLDAVFRRMVARSPDERYQSMDDLIADLTAAQSEADQEPAETLPPSDLASGSGARSTPRPTSATPTVVERVEVAAVATGRGEFSPTATEAHHATRSAILASEGISTSEAHDERATEQGTARRRVVVFILAIVGAMGIVTAAALGIMAIVIPSRVTSENPTSPVDPESVVTNSIDMEFVYIVPGEFDMGAVDDESGAHDEERPRHHVRITRPLHMGKHEVTERQYRQVMGNDAIRTSDAEGKLLGVEPLTEATENLPAVHVSYQDAVEFCRRLSELPEEVKAGRVYRLPTEAEWEYACRAGSTTPYSFGETLSIEDANFGDPTVDAAQRGPKPVGSFPANAWGLFDMHGNVGEWCRDRIGPYESGTQIDPVGPQNGDEFVVRGGGWNFSSTDCRSASRQPRRPESPSQYIGFRVICEVVPQ